MRIGRPCAPARASGEPPPVTGTTERATRMRLCAVLLPVCSPRVLAGLSVSHTLQCGRPASADSALANPGPLHAHCSVACCCLQQQQDAFSLEPRPAVTACGHPCIPSIPTQMCLSSLAKCRSGWRLEFPALPLTSRLRPHCTWSCTLVQPQTRPPARTLTPPAVRPASPHQEHGCSCQPRQRATHAPLCGCATASR